MTFAKHTKAMAITTVVAFAFCVVACSNDDTKGKIVIDDNDSLPFMKTYGVSTVISDSGIVRYKIISEEWLFYQNQEDNTYTWAFEKGLFLEKFNEDYHVDAFINCDTAYYYSRDQLWELRGRVNMKNLKGETFKTTILYWNQGTHTIYSPAYMVIDGIEQDLDGYDFHSNEQMTDYLIHQSSGAFPLDDASSSTPQPSNVDAERLEQNADSTNKQIQNP